MKASHCQRSDIIQVEIAFDSNDTGEFTFLKEPARRPFSQRRQLLQQNKLVKCRTTLPATVLAWITSRPSRQVGNRVLREEPDPPEDRDLHKLEDRPSEPESAADDGKAWKGWCPFRSERVANQGKGSGLYSALLKLWTRPALRRVVNLTQPLSFVPLDTTTCLSIWRSSAYFGTARKPEEDVRLMPTHLRIMSTTSAKAVFGRTTWRLSSWLLPSSAPSTSLRIKGRPFPFQSRETTRPLALHIDLSIAHHEYLGAGDFSSILARYFKVYPRNPGSAGDSLPLRGGGDSSCSPRLSDFADVNSIHSASDRPAAKSAKFADFEDAFSVRSKTARSTKTGNGQSLTSAETRQLRSAASSRAFTQARGKIGGGTAKAGRKRKASPTGRQTNTRTLLAPARKLTKGVWEGVGGGLNYFLGFRTRI